MKKILLPLIMLLSYFVAAQENSQSPIDSLKQVAATQQGIEKVKTYRLIGVYLFAEASLEELTNYFNELEAITLQEAKKDKNSQNAQFYITVYANMKLNYGYMLFNFGDFEGVEKQARDGMNYCRKNNEEEIYYKHYNLLLDALLANQKHQILQQEARNLYNEAKENDNAFGMLVATFVMADVYLKQYRFPESEEYFRKSIALSENANYDNVCYILVQSYRYLVVTLIMQQRYDEALQALQKTEEEVQRLEEREAAIGYASQVERFYLYSYYVDYYLRVKEYDKAEDYFSRVEKIVQSLGDETLYDDKYHVIRAYILEQRGLYAEAYEAAEKADLFVIERANSPMDRCEALNIKARLLIRLDRGKEGIVLYDSVQMLINQIRDTEFNAQLDDIRTQYEVDKHIAEKERTRNYFLFALGVCLLLAIALMIWIYYSRTIVKKNRGLYRQIKEQDRLVEELDAMTKQYDQVTQLIPPTAEEEFVLPENMKLPAGSKQQRQLVSRLRDFLLHDRYFANYDLDIQDLIPKMATNRTSLFEAIKAVTGKTPMEFISDLRLDEAKRLLDNSDLTIETIATECGYTTTRTLHRQFREYYRMTPTEYRKMATAL
ncbi:MAG: AraC family transcriptional regulator [Bacteroidales bacterium]|nr:AraC family transcriptional regulator [Bacteroidales bacterium]